jgi:hypothetical protein
MSDDTDADGDGVWSEVDHDDDDGVAADAPAEAEDVPGRAVSTDGGAVRTLRPPDLRNARFGLLSELYRLHKHHRKRRRLSSKGYVQWLLIDDTYPAPRYVQPDLNGGGIPEVEHDGVRYLFPKKAMLPSEEQGLWTVVHRRGEAEPVNLREPSEDAIKADALDEYLRMRVTTEPPGWLGDLDLDAATLMKVGLALVIGYAVMQSVMTGQPFLMLGLAGVLL